jgi:hypothetical protein
MKDFLAGVGINIALSVAGFFGSLLMIGKSAATDLRTTFMSIIGGVASANYLTPAIVDMLRLSDSEYILSIAFIIGFMGLKLVELVSKKLFKNI